MIEDYRYGFGGHLKDDEVAGNGNHLAFRGIMDMTQDLEEGGMLTQCSSICQVGQLIRLSRITRFYLLALMDRYLTQLQLERLHHSKVLDLVFMAMIGGLPQAITPEINQKNSSKLCFGVRVG